MRVRRAIEMALVLAACGTALWLGTDGFRAVTSEGARRLAVAKQPREIPSVSLEDQDGRVFRLSDYKGKLVVLEFIYTRCPDLCIALGTSLEQVRARIHELPLRPQVVLLSVSFDPAHDGRDQLLSYARRFGGAGNGWQLARPLSSQQMRLLLDVCQVVVKPDGFGGYVHNAAIHIIDRDGRLVRILDLNAIDETIEELARRAA